MKNIQLKHKQLSDVEEAQIQKQVASDPDAPEASDADLAKGMPFGEAFPKLMESIRRSRGRPAVASPRQQISLRLDADVIAKFKQSGKGWQGRVNEVLRKASGL